MGDFATLAYGILDAGTWTNYGSKPKGLNIKLERSRVFNTHEGIDIENARGEAINTVNGYTILKKYRGYLTVYGTDLPTRDNLQADIIAIMFASAYDTKFIDFDHMPRILNRKEVSLFYQITA